jgi:hypothetical protein
VGILVFAASAGASLIAPGQTLPTTGSMVTFSGTGLILNTGPVAFTGKDALNNVVFTGELATLVYADPTNEFAPGDLTFEYQITNDPTSPDALERFTTNSFSGLLTDADYLAGTGNDFPGTVTRQAANNGDSIGYTFAISEAILPGHNSVDIVIATNARTLTTGLVSIQDGGNATFSAPVPVPVPEPASVGILIAGSLTLLRRRRAA